MTRALEAAYAAVRRAHPDVPEAVILIGQGSSTRKGLEKFGHHAPMRWQRGEERMAEIMISGEGLNREARAVMTTIVHEAAHALALARRIKDTARQGRVHNKAFLALAQELGLAAPAKYDPRHGFSAVTMPDATAERYSEEIARLASALKLFRHAEQKRGGAGKGRKDSNNGVRAACSPKCGRSIRVAPSVLELGPIMCGCCGHPFTAPGFGESDDDE